MCSFRGQALAVPEVRSDVCRGVNFNFEPQSKQGRTDCSVPDAGLSSTLDGLSRTSWDPTTGFSSGSFCRPVFVAMVVVLVLNLTIVVEKGALGVDTGPLDWADLATIRVTEEVALAVDLQPGRIDGV